MQRRASVLVPIVMAPSLVDMALTDWKQHPARTRSTLLKDAVAGAKAAAAAAAEANRGGRSA